MCKALASLDCLSCNWCTSLIASKVAVMVAAKGPWHLFLQMALPDIDHRLVKRLAWPYHFSFCVR